MLASPSSGASLSRRCTCRPASTVSRRAHALLWKARPIPARIAVAASLRRQPASADQTARASALSRHDLGRLFGENFPPANTGDQPSILDGFERRALFGALRLGKPAPCTEGAARRRIDR